MDTIGAGSARPQACSPVGLSRLGPSRQGHGATHPRCADATSTQGHVLSGASRSQLPAEMRDVLLVYQEVALQNEAVCNGAPQPLVITVSVDEKPGVQAIGNTAPDLPPVAGNYSTVGRDHEYIRYGTWSILAALDLHNGHVTARVEERHRSVEFIALLQDLDTYYPPSRTHPLLCPPLDPRLPSFSAGL